MGNDKEPMTRAHLTPILLTMGPPRKQTARLRILLLEYSTFLDRRGSVSREEEHTDCKHGISDCVGDIRYLGTCKATTTQACEELAAHAITEQDVIEEL